MNAAEATQLGTTISGQLLIPILVILVSTAIIAGVTAAYKVMGVVRDIKKEVLPNGGASLRDSIDRVEARQLATERALRKRLKVDRAQTARMNEMNEMIEKRLTAA